MLAQTEFSLLYFTAANREDALTISRTLLNEHLIACANLHDNVTSMYRWMGEIEHSHEVQVFAKTRTVLVPAVIERVKSLHSYKLPCVISLPISGGNEVYLQWIGAETELPKPD